MITEVSLTAFKSWKRIEQMRFAPITALFGANSSGKTCVLQWLLLLKQTAESSDRLQVLNFGDERDSVQLGSFRDVVYGHTKGGKVSWELSWGLPEPLKIVDPERRPGTALFTGDAMRYFCEIVEDQARLEVTRLEYDFAGAHFSYKLKEAKSGYQLKNEPESDFRLKRAAGRKWDLPAPVKCYGFPDQVYSYFQNAGFLADFQLAFEQQFTRTYYLGPLREYPKREYAWSGSQPADMGRRGEKVVDAILSARGREKISRGRGKHKLSVEEYAAHWLKELKLIDSFSIRAVTTGSNLYQVHVRKAPHAAEVLITDVGFGISQILPVIVLCYYVPEGSTIILEQPEIHLHPSVQAGLADVFIDAIKARKIQIVLESHSEHLLKRLQRRIAEGEHLDSKAIALYFCDYEDQQSRLVPLDVDLLGNIRNWPKDFFGDEMGEMAAIMRAQLDRRQPA